MKETRVLVVIPAYNEAESILRVIRELRERAAGFDYVVVNDGSTDGTAQLCREHGVNLIDLPENRGLPGAFQAGVRYALEHGYDAVLQLDADGQHDPRYAAEMVRVMTEKKADLVIASRFVTERKPWTLRMAGSRIIAGAIRMTTGQRLTDPTSGMRLWGGRVLKEITTQPNFRPEPDTVALLIRQGARVEEVQVTMRERTAGKSYLRPRKAVQYMAETCFNILTMPEKARQETR